MTISSQLMMSILAMDSYNRGYGQRLDVVGSGASATQIGNAIIGQKSETTVGSAEVAAGFFAQAYTLAGQKIISYRGTDDNFSNIWSDDVGSDPWNGYGTAFGNPQTTQAGMAAEFFQAVTGTSTTNPTAGNAILTGHSLGGGLAGFIGAIYSQQAYMFDNMIFEKAATNAYTYSLVNDPLGLRIRADLFNGFTPNAPVIGSNLQTYATTGEILTANRLLQNTNEIYLDSNGGLRSPVTLHSMALHAILQFAASPNSLVSNDWYSIGKQLWDAGFNIKVADAALAGLPVLGGAYTSEYKMLTALAYSAIDEGTRVFGDTGIRAMFDDANDLGRIVSLANGSTALKDSAGALAEILMQYAGTLAFRKVLDAASATAKDGVLNVSPDNSLLTVDLTQGKWGLGVAPGAAVPTIVGLKTLTDVALGKSSFSLILSAPEGVSTTASSDTGTAMQWLWNDTTRAIIDKISFATNNTALTFTIADRVAASSKVALFVAGDGDEIITGAKDNDFIFGGAGNDTLTGMAGDDLLAGGDGSDILSGGEGRNFLTGGDGLDTARYVEAGKSYVVTIKNNAASTSDSYGVVDKTSAISGTVEKDIIYSIERIDMAANDNQVQSSRKAA
jgi:hypothetical protein